MSLPEIPKRAKSDSQYLLVTTEDQLASLCAEMEAASIIAVDTETEGLDHDDIIVGVCISTKAGTGYYIPLRHEEFDGCLYAEQLPAPLVFAAIGPILETTPCVGHNVKFDDKMLQKDGVRCYFIADTMAIAKLFGTFQSNGLKFLVKEIFGHEMADLGTLFPKRGNKRAVIAPKTLSPSEICHYAVEDANWTLQLFLYFMGKIPKLFANSLFGIEMRLLPVVGEMEAFGIPVSKAFLEEKGLTAREIVGRLEFEILQTIKEALGDPEYTVSLTSPPQLSKLLFEDLGLPVLAVSEKTRKPSTGKEVLEQLADLNPIARSILTHRTLKKLNSTYLEGLIPNIYPDARIRGNFNQFGTASGRFSSSNPNLQNLPRDQTFYLWKASPEQRRVVEAEFSEFLRWNADGTQCEIFDQQKKKWGKKGELGVDDRGENQQPASDGLLYGVEDNILKEMWKCKTRNFVVAQAGHYLVEADYSQVELRIMAGESGEPTLMNAFATEEDVHQATAAVIFDVPFDRVTSEQRQQGKTINFSLLYGAGADNIGKQLGISEDEAQALIDLYFDKLPYVKAWIERVKAHAYRDEKATTPFGRVRHFPFIRKNYGDTRRQARKEQREAVNFKIQGAAADVMKVALVRTGTRLRNHFGDNAKIVSTVHDSVLLEVHDSVSIDDVIRVLNEAMTSPDFLAQIQTTMGGSVRWPALEIDVKAGKSWADAEKVKFPEDMTLPALFEGELPKVRVQRVAIDRELGVTQTSEEVSIFTETATLKAPIPPEEKVAWVIEVPKALNVNQLNGLTDFLREHNDSDAKGEVKLFLPDPSGAVMERALPGTFRLSMEDEMKLRIKIGSCTLRQELEDIDPNEVLRGIDFGL